MIYVYALAFIVYHFVIGMNTARLMMGDKDWLSSLCAFAFLVEICLAVAALVSGE